MVKDVFPHDSFSLNEAKSIGEILGGSGLCNYTARITRLDVVILLHLDSV